MQIDHTALLSDKLSGIVIDLMPDDPVPVRERSSANCSQWDSLFLLNLITSVEQEFEIQLSDAEALELNSFEASLRVLADKLSSLTHAR